MSERLELISSLELRIAELERREQGRLRQNRLSNRRRLWHVFASVVLLMTLPAVVSASHSFTDVPNGHTFHGDIGRAKEAGIASGCTATTFCPEDSVRRGQMTAFLGRGLSRAARSSGVVSKSAAETFDVTGLTIRSPGISGGAGFLVVNGSVTMFTSSSKCPCTLGARLRMGAVSSITMLTTITNTTSGIGAASWRLGTAANTWVFPVPTNTNNDVHLTVFFQPTSDVNDATFTGHLTAVYVPFGSQGGSILSGAALPATEVERLLESLSDQ